MATTVRTRIAPSPTGEPHIGNMYAAMFCKAFAQQHRGQFVMRIEDTDRRRFVPEAVGMLIGAFHWVGLDPDEGPAQGGPYGPYVQSERLPLYQEQADVLVRRGAAYYCFCTPEELDAERKDAERRKVPYVYSRRCLRRSTDEVRRLLADGAPRVVRLRIPDEGSVSFSDAVRGHVTFENRFLTDQIILKSDGFPTSHLAIPMDDHEMHISHVIRAEEWLSSVPYYILVCRASGWPLPEFAHLSVLRNADRSKMSKRRNPTSVAWYRAQGYLPEALLNFLALQGWSHPDGKEIFSFQEFTALLTLDRIVKSGPIFDFAKLDWMNRHYIRELTLDQLADAVTPFLPEPVERDYLLRMLPIVQERLRTLGEIGPLTNYLRHDPDPTGLPWEQAIKRRSQGEIGAALVRLTNVLESFGQPTTEQYDHAVRSLAEELGWKHGDLFMAMRVAITGTNASPPIYESCEVLGWPVAFRRLQAAIGSLPEGGPHAHF